MPNRRFDRLCCGFITLLNVSYQAEALRRESHAPVDKTAAAHYEERRNLWRRPGKFGRLTVTLPITNCANAPTPIESIRTWQ
jgi:hypothetical protein